MTIRTLTSQLGKWPDWLVCLSLCAAGPVMAQSVDRGRQLYENQCMGCHSVSQHRTGPMHTGIVGRLIGKEAGYTYSNALKASQGKWTPNNLNKWLENPEMFLPGQRMGYSVSAPDDRQDIIAYLSTLKRPEHGKSTARSGSD